MSEVGSVLAIRPRQENCPEAEVSVLGALFLDPTWTAENVRGILQVDDFQHPLLGRIFGASLALYDEAGTIDLLTLNDRLGSDRELADTGGVVFLQEAMAHVASPRNVVHHAELVFGAALRRRQLVALQKAARMIEEGNDLPSELLADLESRSRGGPELVCMADVVPEEASWLWHPRIPAGELTLLFGDGGVGKSHVCLAIAAALSRGDGLPGSEGVAEPSASVVFTGEDSLGEARRRLDEMAADPKHVFACGESFGLDSAGLSFVRRSIREHNVELAIIDPVVAFLGQNLDFYRANEVRSVLSPLAAVAHETGAAIILSTHVTKGGTSRAAHRAIGSGDFVNAARSALLAGSDPDDTNNCALCHEKANLGPMAPALGYTIKDGRFTWTGETDLTSVKILGMQASDEDRATGSHATEVLGEMCKDWAPAAEVIAQAEAEGISKRTIQRSAAKLCDRHREGVGTSKQVMHWRLKKATVNAT